MLDRARLRILTFVIPVLFLIAEFVIVWETARIVLHWEKTEAEVVQVYAHDDGTFSPVLRYTWSDGAPTDAGAWISDPVYGFEVGERVKIRYNPEEKTDVRIIGFRGIWAFAAVIGAITGVTWIAALLLWPRIRRLAPG